MAARCGRLGDPFVPRLIGLNIVDRLGVNWFQHLPVVAFAVNPRAPVRLAPTYSFVMQHNFSAPNDDLARFGQVRAPVALLVGADDEIFYADRFAPLLGPAARYDIPGGARRRSHGADHPAGGARRHRRHAGGDGRLVSRSPGGTILPHDKG